MSTGTSPELAPYLNPAYWNGRTLGVGEPHVVGKTDFSPRDSAFARRVIGARVRSNALFPLETFTTGEVFDPASYEPGTVVLYAQETLEGAPVTDDYSLEELSALAVPVRPTATSPSFGDGANVHANDESRYYLSHVRWGVVPRDNNKDCISSAPAWGVLVKGVGANAVAPFVNSGAPITIGETTHTRPSRAIERDRERLQRVNILHILAYGIPETESRKQSIIDLLPRVAGQGST